MYIYYMQFNWCCFCVIVYNMRDSWLVQQKCAVSKPQFTHLHTTTLNRGFSCRESKVTKTCGHAMTGKGTALNSPEDQYYFPNETATYFVITANSFKP